MDEEIHPYHRLVRAIILRAVQDMILPWGKENSRRTTKSAFNFLLNEKSEEYEQFCFWCDLAGFNPQHWRQTALMNLAYELNFKPWLRRRAADYLRGVENWQMLKKYYCDCCEKEYKNFIEAIKNADDN